jgi:hypothetical protein
MTGGGIGRPVLSCLAVAFMPKQRSNILGWIAVILSSLITCFWAFWGIIENFHEGWYYRSTFRNLGLMLIQYLFPMLAFAVVTVIAIVAPRLGSILYVLVGILAACAFVAQAGLSST